MLRVFSCLWMISCLNSGADAQILNASDGVAGDQFGRVVSGFGDSALVSTIESDSNGPSSGSAYYFKGLNAASGVVSENVKLLNSDGENFDRFGISASLFGDFALIGAHFDDDNGSLSGGAYYFKNLDSASGTVTENAKLIASDGAADDLFGESVSLFGNSALVGARDDDNGASSGAGILFHGFG